MKLVVYITLFPWCVGKRIKWSRKSENWERNALPRAGSFHHDMVASCALH